MPRRSSSEMRLVAVPAAHRHELRERSSSFPFAQRANPSCSALLLQSLTASSRLPPRNRMAIFSRNIRNPPKRRRQPKFREISFELAVA